MRTRFLLYVVVVLSLAQFARADDPNKILPPDAGLPIVSWQEAAKHMGEEVVVQGKIVQTRNIGRHCFLNFDVGRTFTAVIHQEGLANFKEPPESTYDQKIVRIRGRIIDYKGKPEIEVSKPDQITILDSDLPIPKTSAVPPAAPKAPDGTFTVATFNVMNMFDEYDDPYTEDEGTPAKPKAELEHLAATIHKLDADVLVLEEVENRGYLERFNRAMLGDLHYGDVVLFEGNDKRGIDCAVLSRFPVGPVTSHRHVRFGDANGQPEHFMRDFLQVEIDPPGAQAFYVFAVHFKSKRGGEDETAAVRSAETHEARKLLDRLMEKEKAVCFLVCGDFNDTWDSEPLKALRGSGPGKLAGFVDELPPDTHTFNQGEYADMIDFILASPEMARRYVKKTYRVLSGSVETNGSDHNPVVAKFRLK